MNNYQAIMFMYITLSCLRYTSKRIGRVCVYIGRTFFRLTRQNTTWHRPLIAGNKESAIGKGIMLLYLSSDCKEFPGVTQPWRRKFSLFAIVSM